MEIGLRTPLLDFFRRGEVARDIRMLAAEGAVAPRPLEQLGLLALLTEDSDPGVRATAEQTLSRLPTTQVSALMARADAPTELREFFAARGQWPMLFRPGNGRALVKTVDRRVAGRVSGERGEVAPLP